MGVVPYREMEEKDIAVGKIVLHKGREHIIHAHYRGTCGRLIAAIAQKGRPHSDGIVCNNVPVGELGSGEVTK